MCNIYGFDKRPANKTVSEPATIEKTNGRSATKLVESILGGCKTAISVNAKPAQKYNASNVLGFTSARTRDGSGIARVNVLCGMFKRLYVVVQFEIDRPRASTNGVLTGVRQPGNEKRRHVVVDCGYKRGIRLASPTETYTIIDGRVRKFTLTI